MDLTIGSLFSGIGGLELGLERAGLGRTIYQVEVDPFCRAVLAKNWPNVQRFEDVRHVATEETPLPYADILCGSFPCQDISSAGTRKGLAGERSGLWFEFARVIERQRPVGVVIENVSRLVGRGLDTVAGALHALGYEVEATRLRASDVGAPHRRERVFIVAVADAHSRGRERFGWAGPLERQLSLWDEPHRRDRPSRPPEPRMGRVPDGLPVWMDGPGPGGGWPAGRGLPQEDWEAPRVAPRKPCITRWRIKALGNAVIPQMAYIAGRRLVQRLEPWT